MAAITTAVIGVAAAGTQIAISQDNARKAKKAIADFNRQELKNPFEEIEISTAKSDQQTEANLVNFASSVDALKRGGVRTVVGGIPTLNQQNILLQNLISQDLDRQEKERQRLIAQGEQRIQGIQEQREERALQGLGQALQTARQDTVTGVVNIASSGLALGSAVNNSGGTSFISPNSAIPSSGSSFSDFTFSNQGDVNASIFDDTNSLLS